MPFGRALLTDVWYTLAYYRPAERAGIELARHRALTRALGCVGVPAVRSKVAVAHWEEKIRAEERQGWTPPLDVRVRELARSMGVRLDFAALVETFDLLVERRPPHVAPGARRTLRSLRRQGYRVGAVSNVVFESAPGARRLLDQLGLTELLDAVALSADDGVAKPDPRPFLRCLRQLEVRPADAWYVGDMPTDVTGARAAGIRAIRFAGLGRYRPRVPPAPPGFARPIELHRWAHLPDLLRSRARDRQRRE